MNGASRGLFVLVVGAAALALTVVVLGAYTRLVDAGLGCPDWPGCYGRLLAPNTAEEVARAMAAYPSSPVDVEKAWTEMAHRYLAAALGIAILAILAWVLRARLPWRLPAALTGLVIAQGAFGAWTVTLKLWPQIVSAHLLGGFATLGLLWLLVLLMRPPPSWGANRGLRGLATAALVVLAVQVALGGWVSSNYAALACPDFPACHGEWLPAMDFAAGFNIAQDVGPNYLGGLLENSARVAIHFTHRLGAVAVLAVTGWLALRLGNGLWGWALALALAAQLGLGVANVVLALPLAIAVLHNAGAAALMLVLVGVNYAAWRGGASGSARCRI